MIVQIAEILQETREWYEKSDQLDLAGGADFGLFGDDQPGSVYVTVYVKRCGEEPRRFLFFTGENVKCKTQNAKRKMINFDLSSCLNYKKTLSSRAKSRDLVRFKKEIRRRFLDFASLRSK